MLNHIEEAVLGGKTRFLRSNIAAIVNYKRFEIILHGPYNNF